MQVFDHVKDAIRNLDPEDIRKHTERPLRLLLPLSLLLLLGQSLPLRPLRPLSRWLRQIRLHPLRRSPHFPWRRLRRWPPSTRALPSTRNRLPRWHPSLRLRLSRR